jgi:hypothetical protein
VSGLTPNSPSGRFEHVLRTYWGKKVGEGEYQITLDGVILDIFAVTLALIGAENVGQPSIGISHEIGDIDISFDTHELSIERLQNALDIEEPALGSYTAQRLATAKAAQAMLARLGQPYEYDAQGFMRWGAEEWALASVVLQVVKLPAHSPADFLIPWVARELVKLARVAISKPRRPTREDVRDERGFWPHQASRADYNNAVHTLVDKAPAIAQWAKETRTDIGKVDLAQALATVAKYKFKTSLVEQGVVVYTFKDGWTVQELRTELALSQEGKQMQNCIAGYFDDVIDNTARIYSIRDASGAPHVSMELAIPGGVTRVQASDMSPEEFIESRTRLDCYFAQILGKQNDMPIDEYRARAREFIDKVFDKEGLGWVIAGGTPTWGRFEGREWQGVDFPDVLGTNHVGEDVLAETIFDRATIDRCSFTGMVGPKSFARAEISETNFQGTVLHEADFEGVKGYFVDFRSAVLSDASFDSAHLGGSDFRRSTIGGANFRDARVDGVKFDGAQGGESANWENVELTTAQKGQLGLP